jgi:hypothetical protein
MQPDCQLTSCAGSTVLATRRSTSGDPDMAGQVFDARKLKALEDENRRLKKLLAESMRRASTLKEMLGKNF